ncbi:hypothetical protein H0H93_001082, partial [Arthromyces matolae]
ATYSGIPVYEMMCKGVAVMRRRSDSWLNATQILKVAGFDKPQRTRVLEREVQKGEHEKVQGGYGKYQGPTKFRPLTRPLPKLTVIVCSTGTWIPLERGVQLAKQYNCENLLRPIIEFQPAAKSPPLAPKHLVASTTRPTRRPPTAETSSTASVINTRSSRRHPPGGPDDESDRETLSARGSEDGSMTPSPSEASSSSRTPSPINSPAPSYDSFPHGDDRRATTSKSRRNKHRHTSDHQFDDAFAGEQNGVEDARNYGDQILEYFISDTSQIPPVLISPPRDFDPNMAIDDDGHTALHWACAMGRIRIVKLLLTAGADIFKVNKAGQTPLMRSVMFANNYDVRKFPELYELLHRSTLNIDNYNRTLFHHIVDVAMSKGKSHAARYYMETVLTRLADYPKELADVINFQDEDGETALTMAARCRSKRLVKLLIDHGADPKLVNNDGKSTEDYIIEDERFRSSPVPPSRAHSMSFRNAQASYPPPNSVPNYSFAPVNGDRPPLHHSVAAQRASTRCVNDIASMLDSLANAFDQELKEKERDMTQAHALLGNIQGEILDSQRSVSSLKAQSEGLPQVKEKLQNLETELHVKMGRRYRLGWEKWVKDEEAREAAIRDAANGELAVTAKSASYRVDQEMDIDGVTAEKPTAKQSPPSQMEDISDLIALHANIPTDPDEVHKACEALREELGDIHKRRKTIFDELVSFQAEAGTSGRMAEYRRLIGAGCGGVPPSEVDQVLGMLLETLESEETSPSTHLRLTMPAPAVGLTRRQVQQATTAQPWTKNFRHLLPIPKKFLKRFSIRDPLPKTVRPRDRIKYWNIVPGDQIRLLGDKNNTLHEVLSINRFSNRVFVKGQSNTGEVPDGKIPPSKNYHYSRCQLFLGNYEFPPTAKEPKTHIVPVFAKRVGTSRPFWNRFFGRYDWQRFAIKTVPTVSHLVDTRISIPWPKPAVRSKPEGKGAPFFPTRWSTHVPPARSIDTTEDEVVKVTYKQPAFHPLSKGLIPRPPPEESYLRTLYNPHVPNIFADSPLLEVYLFRELSNPHSRAKKHARWLQWQKEKKERYQALLQDEMDNLNGRSPREAKAEAAFKWRQQVEEENEALRKQRWKKIHDEATLEKRSKRRERKEAKLRQRLTALSLKVEPNQVIPESMRS